MSVRPPCPPHLSPLSHISDAPFYDTVGLRVCMFFNPSCTFTVKEHQITWNTCMSAAVVVTVCPPPLLRPPSISVWSARTCNCGWTVSSGAFILGARTSERLSKKVFYIEHYKKSNTKQVEGQTVFFLLLPPLTDFSKCKQTFQTPLNGDWFHLSRLLMHGDNTS